MSSRQAVELAMGRMSRRGFGLHLVYVSMGVVETQSWGVLGSGSRESKASWNRGGRKKGEVGHVGWGVVEWERHSG